MADTAWIDDLKVAELKDHLKQRGLPAAGVKAVLAERLREACAQVSRRGNTHQASRRSARRHALRTPCLR